jgi:hypothetical protein
MSRKITRAIDRLPDTGLSNGLWSMATSDFKTLAP